MTYNRKQTHLKNKNDKKPVSITLLYHKNKLYSNNKTCIRQKRFSKTRMQQYINFPEKFNVPN